MRAVFWELDDLMSATCGVESFIAAAPNAEAGSKSKPPDAVRGHAEIVLGVSRKRRSFYTGNKRTSTD